MGILKKNDHGELELDGRALQLDEPIEVQLFGIWVKGTMTRRKGLGPLFVGDDGEAEFIGLDGATARFPVEGASVDPLEEAYEELIGAARQAAAVFELFQRANASVPEKPGWRTFSRLRDALYIVSQRRGDTQRATI
jgi:hypothetical protein